MRRVLSRWPSGVAEGGYSHDGRFADLHAVVDHYNQAFGLRLTEHQQVALVEYLKSL
jgi:cytochrome c peroxidase